MRIAYFTIFSRALVTVPVHGAYSLLRRTQAIFRQLASSLFLYVFITFLGWLGVGTIDRMEHGGVDGMGMIMMEDKSSRSYLFSSYRLLLQLSTEKKLLMVVVSFSVASFLSCFCHFRMIPSCLRLFVFSMISTNWSLTTRLYVFVN
jgi:hypothetical protein